MAFTLLQPVETTLNTAVLNLPPGSAWNTIVETAIKDMRDTCKVLHTFKKMYNPLGDRSIDVWKCVTEFEGFMPSFGPIQEKIKDLEKETTAVDWTHLDRWINGVEESTRKRLNYLYRDMLLYGVDPLGIATAKDMSTIFEKIKSSPLVQWQEFTMGPNWASCMKEVDCISCNNPADFNGIPVELFSPKVLGSAAEVMRRWKKLKEMAAKKLLDSFEQEWAELTTSARIRWLKEKYPELPSYPHSDLYAWVQDSKLEKKLFMAPLLNIEDLSQDDVLPRLLRAREALHPAFFRSIDGRSVNWGMWCGALGQVNVKGMMSITPETGHGTESYGISLQPKIDSESFSLPGFNQVRPIIGLYQLQAQLYTYDFLVSCPQSLLCPSRLSARGFANEGATGGAGQTGVFSGNLAGVPGVPGGHVDAGAFFGGLGVGLSGGGTACGGYPTLLARCARKNYGRSANTIDLEYVGDLLSTSLDEALDALSQQRVSPDSWAMRAGTSSGSASNLLRAIFGRIDTFHTLCFHLDAVLKHDWRKAQDGPTAPPENREAFRQIVSLHVALKSTLNEILCQMKDIKWSADKNSSIIFSRLFNLLKEDETSLRVIGIHAVMRMIDREIEKVEAHVRIPFAVMCALNDMSVLAVCLEETSKHYNFASHSSTYSLMTMELVARWETRQRPFMSVIEDTLHALGKSEVKKLDVLVRKMGDSLPSRHSTFWTAVDKYMGNSSQSNEVRSIVDKIQQTPIALINSKVSPVSYPPHSAHEPTRTQIRRCNRRRDVKVQSPTILSITAPMANSPSPPSIVIKPTKNINFWTALLAPSSENGSELFWTDFCKAMEGIGYQIYSQGGSGRRFEGEPGVIVFHEPHGHKITHQCARSEWLKRLSKRFEVKLE